MAMSDERTKSVQWPGRTKNSGTRTHLPAWRKRLDWNAGDMAIAVQYLADWYTPLRSDDDPYDKLLAIALRLQAAVDINNKTEL